MDGLQFLGNLVNSLAEILTYDFPTIGGHPLANNFLVRFSWGQKHTLLRADWKPFTRCWGRLSDSPVWTVSCSCRASNKGSYLPMASLSNRCQSLELGGNMSCWTCTGNSWFKDILQVTREVVPQTQQLHRGSGHLPIESSLTRKELNGPMLPEEKLSFCRSNAFHPAFFSAKYGDWGSWTNSAGQWSLVNGELSLNRVCLKRAYSIFLVVYHHLRMKRL